MLPKLGKFGDLGGIDQIVSHIVDLMVFREVFVLASVAVGSFVSVDDFDEGGSGVEHAVQECGEKCIMLFLQDLSTVHGIHRPEHRGEVAQLEEGQQRDARELRFQRAHELCAALACHCLIFLKRLGALVSRADVEPRIGAIGLLVEADALAYYNAKVAQNYQVEIRLKELEIQLERAKRWDGRQVPEYVPLTAAGGIVNLPSAKE